LFDTSLTQTRVKVRSDRMTCRRTIMP